jgi:hypothetical protein
VKTGGLFLWSRTIGFYKAFCPAMRFNLCFWLAPQQRIFAAIGAKLACFVFISSNKKNEISNIKLRINSPKTTKITESVIL